MIGDQPTKRIHSDNWKSYKGACRLLGIQREKSQSNMRKSNGLIGNVNLNIEEMTRRALLAAGLPSCFCPVATPCSCHSRNISVDDEQGNPNITKGTFFTLKDTPFHSVVACSTSQIRQADSLRTWM
jgi:hypothetical protein